MDQVFLSNRKKRSLFVDVLFRNRVAKCSWQYVERLFYPSSFVIEPAFRLIP